MKVVIHKQALPLFGENVVELPARAHVLSVHEQNNLCCLWYAYDPDRVNPYTGAKNETEIRYFIKEATGDIFDDNVGRLKFIGSVFYENAKYVHHVFERVTLDV